MKLKAEIEQEMKVAKNKYKEALKNGYEPAMDYYLGLFEGMRWCLGSRHMKTPYVEYELNKPEKDG